MNHQYDISELKRRVNILDLIGKDVKLREVKSSKSEWVGPCPFCKTGDDRFHCWPPEGRFWCRVCGASGDVLDYIKARYNLDPKGAIDYLARFAGMEQTIPTNNRIEPVQKSQEFNESLFLEQAESFIENCKIDICRFEKAANYLLARGITTDSIIEFEIGYNPEERWESPENWGKSKDDKKIWLPRGITIPNRDKFGLHGIKIRRPIKPGQLDSDGKEARKYVQVAGSRNWLYSAGPIKNDAHLAYLQESEFDAILAYQAGFYAQYYSLPAGLQIDKPEYTPYFQDVDFLIICMDSDDRGRAAAEKHMKVINTILADPFPLDCKDLGEYYLKTKSMDSILEWLLIQADKINEGI